MEPIWVHHTSLAFPLCPLWLSVSSVFQLFQTDCA
jgi:hypothetical protein